MARIKIGRWVTVERNGRNALIDSSDAGGGEVQVEWADIPDLIAALRDIIVEGTHAKEA